MAVPLSVGRVRPLETVRGNIRISGDDMDLRRPTMHRREWVHDTLTRRKSVRYTPPSPDQAGACGADSRHNAAPCRLVRPRSGAVATGADRASSREAREDRVAA